MASRPNPRQEPVPSGDSPGRVRPADASDALRERGVVMATAAKVLHSGELNTGEQAHAAAILSANPHLGNPHVVRCHWCHATRMLFRNESDDAFTQTAGGWLCGPCDTRAASQEIRL